MALEDLNNWFENLRNPSETVDTETIISNITAVYNEDLSIRDTAVQDRETRLAEAQAAITDLKNKNYDLLMKAGTGTVSTSTDNSQQQSDDERAATVTFADIFNKEKK